MPKSEDEWLNAEGLGIGGLGNLEEKGCHKGPCGLSP